MQITWPELWQAVIALATLIGMIVAGGSLYVKMSIQAAIASMIATMDGRYVRREEVELIAAVAEHMKGRNHVKETA